LPKILFWQVCQTEAGEGVILSSYVVEHHIGSASLRESVAIASAGRAARAGSPALQGTRDSYLPCRCAGVDRLCGGPVWWPVIAFVLLVRMFAAYVVRPTSGALRASMGWARVVAFGFWLADFSGIQFGAWSELSIVCGWEVELIEDFWCREVMGCCAARAQNCGVPTFTI